MGDNRLKIAEPWKALPALPPEALCDFIDWVADYTLNPPGAILAMALRSRAAFEAGDAPHRLCARATPHPARACLKRGRARWRWQMTGWRVASAGLAEDANVSPAVVRGLIEAGALVSTELPEFAPFPQPDPDFATARTEPRPGARRQSLARRGGGEEIFRPSAGRRHRVRARPKSISRRWLRRSPRQTSADPAAGDRTDGAVPGTFCGTFRRAARRNGTAIFRKKNGGAPIAR